MKVKQLKQAIKDLEDAITVLERINEPKKGVEECRLSLVIADLDDVLGVLKAAK